jgi:hypothetical protein
VTSSEPRGHVLYIWTPTGYRLEDRDGPVPELGAEVDLGEHGRQTVQKIGASPFPADDRPCVFLTAEP